MAKDNGTVRIRSNAVAVVGLRDFQRELKKVITEGGTTGDAMLKDANWRVAQYIVEKSQARAATVGRMQARAAEGLKASKTAVKAQVSANIDKTSPFFFGAEFGAKPNILRSPRRAAGWAGPGRYRGYRQFLPWKKPGSGNTGYFLFPTLREESDNIREMYGQEIDKIMRDVFPENVNG